MEERVASGFENQRPSTCSCAEQRGDRGRHDVIPTIHRHVPASRPVSRSELWERLCSVVPDFGRLISL